VHPCTSIPGGQTKGITEEQRQEIEEMGRWAIVFAEFSLQLFNDIVLGNNAYVDLILGETYHIPMHYIGTVDENNHVNFYDGQVSVVDPDGKRLGKFDPKDYSDWIAEHVEPWTYLKFPYLKKIGWKGFVEGEDSGVYSVAPLARLNACEGVATPRASWLYERYFETLGGRPVHHTLANHWARVIEIVYAAERFQELIHDNSILDPNIRLIPTETPKEGVGVVEAPRGVLIHHYTSDERGVLTSANLLVATQHNAARIAMSVDKAAKSMIHGGVVDDGILNQVEMAFRAYDPCHACATHSMPGHMPLLVSVFDENGTLVQEIRRDG